MSDPKLPKHVLTDDERLELISKLDQDLENYMNSLEKKPYTEGWPEESWEQEMEKHPFFMTKSPENGEVAPLIEGLQQLKYDDTLNTPIELAEAYKEDGNFNFKHKKYRMAIISYTEGLRQKCGDAKLEAALYNNRSAAQFFIQNYRSCLNDCEKCLKIDETYDKARIRAIESYMKIGKPEEALTHCSILLERNPNDSTILDLNRKANDLQKEKLRNERKAKKEENKMTKDLNDLKEAIKARNLRISTEVSLQAATEKPKLVGDNILAWPVCFLYPEYECFDFIEQFSETETIRTMLEEVFSERPEWDKESKYIPENFNVYYRQENGSTLYQINIDTALGKVLELPTFVIKDWKASFAILVAGSSAETKYFETFDVVKKL